MSKGKKLHWWSVTGALYRKDRVSQSAPGAGLNWTEASGQWKQ